ncbi:MAG TPA: double-strand break repair protein AddB, partial [Rhizomicrobium sp.]|nr:double-strand break repair protein AddB [Rhizomicrobium sp.]
MPNVLTIPAGAPFAETLAKGLIARVDLDKDKLALSKTTIFLPTRRAARGFAEVFARLQGGAVLLPDLRALGDVDEDELLFDDNADDLAPSIAPIRRRLLLAALVRRWDKQARGGSLSFAQAASLAGDLGTFFDEAETQRVDLAKLDTLVEGVFAAHWTQVKDFLKYLREAWPAILAAEGTMDPAARREMVLAALAARLKSRPPDGPVIAAGSTGSIPATADLLRVIADLPNGAVVLPGLDRELDAESWDSLDPGHPQYGMKQLLGRIGVERKDVGDWQPAPAGNPARETLLREVMRPAPTTDAWRAIAEGGADEIVKGLNGLSIIETAHPGEEATAIALILREALEPNEADPQKKRTAALVTPDRNLARRVAAEMRRWNIDIDDSAGRPLANTPPGTFLCLIAEAADEQFAPVPLLALLKHPLASGGEATAEFRRKVRMLDRLVLRGPRPDPGLDGIAHAIATAEQDARDRDSKSADVIASLKPWFAKLTDILREAETSIGDGEAEIGSLLAAHVKVAEALAATDTERGSAILWRGDAGNSAADLVAALELAGEGIGAIEASSYPVLFRALAEERPIRPAYGRHPRLAILGALEARLQSFDVVILGGLNEGTWPRAANVDPWLSRPMRDKLGLEQPEREIGLSAHDFAALAAGPRVVLSRALKENGSPTIPSRWLQRLWQLTTGLKIVEKLRPPQPYEEWARALNQPADAPARMKRTAALPSLEQRPNNLSVTEIETWLRDPYAIYAKHVLGLRPLDPLDAEIGPLERGTAVHKALELFLRGFDKHLPADAAERLIEIGNDIFRDIPKATLAIWRPRFERAARWFVTAERARRAAIQDIHLEIEGRREFSAPQGTFTLRGRADRIDVLRSGGAAIVDYKTGKPPTDKQVKTLSPQLPLEGLILAAGGFVDIGAKTAEELIYIRYSGDADPGAVRYLKDVP